MTMRLLVKANRARLQHEIKNAASCYETILESLNSARVMWILALSYFERFLTENQPGLGGKALDSLKEALTLDPSEPEFHVTNGDFHSFGIVVPDPKAAESSYRKALELCPTIVDASVGLAASFFPPESTVTLDEAIQALEQAVRFRPDHGSALRLLGTLYHDETGDRANGRRYHRRALLCPTPLSPDELEEIEQRLRGYRAISEEGRNTSYWTLPELDIEIKRLFDANRARFEQRYLDAAQNYAVLLEMQRQDADLMRMLGLSKFQAALGDLAMGTYETGVTLVAGDERVVAPLENARQWLDRAVALEPTDAVFYVTRGDIYRHSTEAGDYQVAATSYREALVLNSHLTEASIGLSYLAGVPESGVTLDEALEGMQRAAREQPDDSLAWLELGNLHYLAGDHERSRSAYANSLLCSRPLPLEHVGIIEQRFAQNDA